MGIYLIYIIWQQFIMDEQINMNNIILLTDNNDLILTNELLRIVMDRYRFE